MMARSASRLVGRTVYDSASPGLRAAIDQLIRELDASDRPRAADRTRIHQLLELAATTAWRCVAGDDHEAIADHIARELDA
jgi:hypothetical protein